MRFGQALAGFPLLLVAASSLSFPGRTEEPAGGLKHSAARAKRAMPQNVILANPSNYISLLKRLRPGSTLLLQPGIYNDPDNPPGLPLFNLHGEPDKPIVITGPDSGPRPILQAREGSNTIRLVNVSYLVVRNLVLDGLGMEVDAVKAQGTSHHITLENLLIKNHGYDQSVVAISTKAPAWNWIIRNNVIVGAGTGMYLGNSDGNAPFVAGLIENNLIVDTIGYNIEIKQQNSRPEIPGMPTAESATVIRNNVFSKANGGATDEDARPNLLVGHFPLSGLGSNDTYQIYGNFFYLNPTGECLFQGEGNVALYSNLFFNPAGDAICIQPHKDVPRMIRIFYNTVVAGNRGVIVRGGSSSYRQKVMGNAVFAPVPILASDQRDNVTGSLGDARSALANLDSPLGQMDLFPRPGKLNGGAIDTSPFRVFPDWNIDFNGNLRMGNFRGAYSGAGKNPGWYPRLEIKPHTATTTGLSPK